MKFSASSIAVRKNAWPTLPKILLIMKLTTLMLIIGLLQVSAKGFSQISLKENEAPITKVLESIKQQSGYYFFYDEDQLKDKKVSITITNSSLEETLSECFKSLPFSYEVIGKNVVISRLKVAKAPTLLASVISDTVNVHGRVVDNSGQPLPGATITVTYKNIAHASIADKNGEFAFSVNKGTLLRISFVGYTAREIKAASNLGDIALQQFNATLDETRVIGYGTESRRFSVGSTSSITAKDIENQPVTNILQALEGQIPGLVVTPSNGVPGSQNTLQIRGQNSLKNNPTISSTIKPYDQPLIIIDGVPFAPQNNVINQFTGSEISAGGTSLSNSNTGLTGLNSLNPSDIESISVLKDADATSIYGSQGANGVILITTKKGKPGKTNLTADINTSVNAVARPTPLLNTPQYLQLRNNALKADGTTITPGNSSSYPDLTVFDQNKYTNWYDKIFVRTPITTNAHLQLSGGTVNNTFIIAGGYTHQDYNYPGNYADNRYTLHSNLHNSSLNNKLTIDFTSDFSYDRNTLGGYGGAGKILLPPNTPDLVDPNGNLVWSYKGVNLSNYQFNSFLKRDFSNDIYSLNEDLNIVYKILRGLNFTLNMGYNRFNNLETDITPSTAQSPAYGPTTGNNAFANSIYQTVNIDPSINYNRSIGKGTFTALIGVNYKKNSSYATSIAGSGYTNDNLLGSINGAPTVTVSDNSSIYKASAIFGRLTYVYDQKYTVAVTGRRDGSSNFGPGRQFGNFGSLGLGWIFSEENFFKPLQSVISYAKISSNYGTTGSDGIGPYQYQPFWQPIASSTTFQGTKAYQPLNLYNPNYSWATSKKLNLALDLGFFNNRLLLRGNYYIDREGNQLTDYPLPAIAGFTSVVENLNATVQNSGWEIDINSTNIKTKDFVWTSSFNTSINRNKLISFPGLANSSYANLYEIGMPTSISHVFRYKDVNPTTGVFEFYTANGGVTSTPVSATAAKGGDLVPISYAVPKFNGGFGNSFSYKRINLSFFFQFSKQTALNWLYAIYSNTAPGGITNEPVQVLGNYWQKPGDNTPLQKLTASYGDAYNAAFSMIRSTGVYQDDTYLRLKTLSVSYSLPTSITRRMNMTNFRLFIRTQNLLTFTNYKVGDPEQPGSLTAIPLQRTLDLGLSFNF
jgi:TonB-linked SusC/RagA family outer membrane protein